MFLTIEEQKVFWFQVSVANFMTVAVRHSLEHHYQKFGSTSFRVVVPLSDLRKQLTPSTQLAHNVHVPSIFKNIDELNNIWVLKRLTKILLEKMHTKIMKTFIMSISVLKELRSRTLSFGIVLIANDCPSACLTPRRTLPYWPCPSSFK
jgi:hypothetical protein